MLRGLMAITFILLTACGNKYVLTIENIAPDKSKELEKHSIYADNDSAAYSQATVIFFLALHAYNRTAEGSKPYVTEPVQYKVVNARGDDVGSILGAEKLEKIRDLKKSMIN